MYSLIRAVGGVGVALSIIAALALAVAVRAPTGSAHAANAPIHLTFEKSDPDGNFVWNGTIGGDVTGTLETVLLDAQPTGEILQVEFDWSIDTPDPAFTARLNGILNLKTGGVVMNGQVVAGDHEGAQVHEQGQLVDAGTSTFEGIIVVMPATDGS